MLRPRSKDLELVAVHVPALVPACMLAASGVGVATAVVVVAVVALAFALALALVLPAATTAVVLALRLRFGWKRAGAEDDELLFSLGWDGWDIGVDGLLHIFVVGS